MIEPTEARPLLYLAAPLFSNAEQSFNSYLKLSLNDFFNVYLPQEDGALMPDLLSSGMSIAQAGNIIFKNDTLAIRQCDVILVVLDGRSVDEGACLELGFAFALGKTCIGLQTDFRRLAPFGNNPMIEGALSQTFTDVVALTEWASSWAKETRRI